MKEAPPGEVGDPRRTSALGQRRVGRELLPCRPSFDDGEVDVKCDSCACSRSVRSRLWRKVLWKKWANEGVTSLNEVYGHTCVDTD